VPKSTTFVDLDVPLFTVSKQMCHGVVTYLSSVTFTFDQLIFYSCTLGVVYRMKTCSHFWSQLFFISYFCDIYVIYINWICKQIIKILNFMHGIL